MFQNSWDEKRKNMVDTLRTVYHIQDERILAAMLKIPRHLFVPEKFRQGCDLYGDHPCPIGFGQTISQPYIVAYMTELLALQAGEKVLEIGTGSGYQSAVLGELGAKIFSLEIVPELADHARQVLKAHAYDNVYVRWADGYSGWAEQAPFTIIIGTCAPENIPASLIEQLAEGGKILFPVGTYRQQLILCHKNKGKLFRQKDLLVRFVPMVS